MSTLTINIDDTLKASVQKKSKKEGITLTALISQFFKSYLKNECGLTLRFKDEIWEAHHEGKKAVESKTAKLYHNVDQMFEEILNESE